MSRSPLARPAHVRAIVLSLVVVLLSAGAPAAAATAQTEEATVLTETQICADLGRKQPGEPADAAMAAHIAERFAAAGLEVAEESFHMPVFDVAAVSAEVLTPQAAVVPATSFAYGGTGTVEADVVHVGTGRPSDYAGVDAEGKIVLVDRDTTFHRSAQLNEVVAHGGAAMLYISEAPDNLIQVGTVRFAQHPSPEIPTVTVGSDDGEVLRGQAADGSLRMRLTVDATTKDALGVNVIGTKVGTTYPDHIVMVGGHYDSWFDGAVDNCSGIGSMLQMVEAVADVDLAYTVIFGAWDAEETGLVGSYDWVRRHPDLVERIVVNENLEMTSAATQLGDNELDQSLINLIFGTTGPAMNGVIATALARTGHVGAPTTAAGIRSIQGGIIPTDLQPFYTAGVQGFSTFSSSSYYHTTDDTTEHIPDGAHERVTAFLTQFLLDVQEAPPESLAIREVPTVTVQLPATVPTGEPVEVTITVEDPTGRPLTGSEVMVLLNERDHWPVLLEAATEVGDGVYTFTIEGADLDAVGTHWVTASLSDEEFAAEGYASTDVTEGPFRRFAGVDRVATAAAVSGAAFDSAQTVVIATASTFADALAGSPLAVTADAPLLLTDPDRLSVATQQEIRRLGAARALVLGGTEAVSPLVEADLVALGLQVERIAGADRYATAAAVADRVGVTDRAIIASGEDYPDALSASAVASAKGTPVLLSRADALPAVTVEALGDSVAVTLVGGEAVLSAAVAQQVGAVAASVQRISGATRYATSAAIASAGLADGLVLDGVWLATGRGFPDGLVAGAAAGRAGVPLLLIDGLDPEGSRETTDLLRANRASLRSINVAGGAAVITDEVLAALLR